MLLEDNLVFALVLLLFGFGELVLSQTQPLSEYPQRILVLKHTLVVNLLRQGLRPIFGVFLLRFLDF